MKTIVNRLSIFNKVLMIITCLLLFTVYLGMYAEILLGASQVISCLILFGNWSKLHEKDKTNILIYSSLVFIYFLIWYFFDVLGTADEFYKVVIWIIVIPMLLAFYFTSIIETIKKRIV